MNGDERMDDDSSPNPMAVCIRFLPYLVVIYCSPYLIGCALYQWVAGWLVMHPCARREGLHHNLADYLVLRCKTHMVITNRAYF